MYNIKLLEEAEDLNLNFRSGADLMMPLQISIGEIAVPVSSLLDLERLNTIQVNLPENALVTLLLGGEPLATAEMKIVDDKVKLKINQVFLDQIEETNDNEVVDIERDQDLLRNNNQIGG